MQFCLNKNTKGSILIWSLMLGMVLTSVFFFFAMRQRATIQMQRSTADILNAKGYLKSYADYIEGLDVATLTKKSTSGGFNFDNIIAKVNKMDGIVDVATTKSKTHEVSGLVFIEWNKCPIGQKGDLYLSDKIVHKSSKNRCNDKKEYNDFISFKSDKSFTIKTVNTPFEYRITAENKKTDLKNNKWQMDLKINLDYGKEVSIKRVFVPKVGI